MSHAQTWHDIPWFVNGRVDDEQRERIEAHLGICEECRREVQAQRQIMSAIAGDNRLDCVPGASFQRLQERILAAERSPEPDRIAPRSERPRVFARWLVAAVAVEALAITTLATLLAARGNPEPPAVYRTVSTPPAIAAGGIIRVVFKPELSLSELQQLLAQSRLEIVAGPTEAGVYTLAAATPTEQSDVMTSLRLLRASSAVRFAEPIGKSPSRDPQSGDLQGAAE